MCAACAMLVPGRTMLPGGPLASPYLVICDGASWGMSRLDVHILRLVTALSSRTPLSVDGFTARQDDPMALLLHRNGQTARKSREQTTAVRQDARHQSTDQDLPPIRRGAREVYLSGSAPSHKHGARKRARDTPGWWVPLSWRSVAGRLRLPRSLPLRWTTRTRVYPAPEDVVAKFSLRSPAWYPSGSGSAPLYCSHDPWSSAPNNATAGKQWRHPEWT